nr:hypothetical protein [Achromobacter sp. UMC71]
MIVQRVALSVVCASALSGCNSLLSEGTSAGAGIAGAAIANKLTDNATVATGIGLGVQAGAKAALAYAQRKTRGEEQDAIARAAAPLAVGEVADWRVKHQLPIEGDAQGQVTISRLIGDQDLRCKEVVFSIDRPADTPQREFYITTVCQDGEQWRWANAEPATARWGSLQ